MACRTACQMQNKLPAGESFIRYEFKDHGVGSAAQVESIPMQCMQCGDAPCERVCPTGATYTSEDGIVTIDQGKCIGCKYCMAACPYQVRVVNEQTGTVDKCRFCTVSATHGTQMNTCVTACNFGARLFGDLDDPNSEISVRISETNAQPLAGPLTDTKVFYVR